MLFSEKSLDARGSLSQLKTLFGVRGQCLGGKCKELFQRVWDVDFITVMLRKCALRSFNFPLIAYKLCIYVLQYTSPKPSCFVCVLQSLSPPRTSLYTRLPSSTLTLWISSLQTSPLMPRPKWSGLVDSHTDWWTWCGCHHLKRTSMLLLLLLQVS